MLWELGVADAPAFLSPFSARHAWTSYPVVSDSQGRLYPHNTRSFAAREASLQVYYAFITCLLRVHHVFVTCSSRVHHVFITGILLVVNGVKRTK